MTIWKFEIKPQDEIVLAMPTGARILTVQTQGGNPMLWAIVSPDAKVVRRTVYVRGTGHQMGVAEGAAYIGTFQMLKGSLVFHVFDGGEHRTEN